MKSTLLATTALLFTSALATPVVETRQSASEEFLLKTRVIPGIDDCGTNKDGLYLASYHTGAGLGAATVGDAQDHFILNNTGIYFTYNGTIGPWPLDIQFGPYQLYNAIEISIAGGEATTPMFFNATGLQLNSTQFGGWLVCDSWYQDPQLYAISAGYGDNFPKSCSKVEMLKEKPTDF